MIQLTLDKEKVCKAIGRFLQEEILLADELEVIDLKKGKGELYHVSVEVSGPRIAREEIDPKGIA